MSILKITIGSLVALYLLLVLVLYFFQENFIFLGEPLPQNYRYSFNTPFQERNFTMKDGAVINALHFQSREKKGIIYYHHGNAGNLVRWGEVAEYFVSFGYDVLIYDYRGYGKSTGKRTEKILHQDAQYIYDALAQDWRSDQIVIYGRSLGSGMASHVAANNAAKLLILETPFYSLQSMASWRFPFLPTRWLVTYNMKNWQRLQEANLPIHMFHGTEDSIVPYWSGKKLYEAVSDKATLTTIEGAEHNNLIEFEEFREGVRRVLTSTSL